MNQGVEIEGITYDTYLGDGVYAGFDGTQVWLGTQREVWYRIALDAGMFARLGGYLACREDMRKCLGKTREDTGK